MHLSSQSGTIESDGCLLKFHVLISVRKNKTLNPCKLCTRDSIKAYFTPISIAKEKHLKIFKNLVTIDILVAESDGFNIIYISPYLGRGDIITYECTCHPSNIQS